MYNEEEVLEVLRECYDPEMPVNIVDLGLVYHVDIKGAVITVEMTLTAPGCSMGAMIASEIQDKLLGIVLNKADTKALARYESYQGRYYYQKYYARYGYVE